MKPAFRAAALLAAGLTACGGSDAPTTTNPSATTLTVASGNGQSAAVGDLLAQPIIVSAVNRNGPVNGLVVSFQVESGGGNLSRTQATTDLTGTVGVTWTLGGGLGEQRLQISAPGATPVTAVATASPGAPSVILPVEGAGQFAVVRRPVPKPVRIQVTDLFGHPLGAIPVKVSVSQGGGTISDSAATTDASGFATLGTWTLGPVPGSNRIRTVAGSAAADILATGTAGSLLATSGDQQTANVGTQTALRPMVTAYDADGQPLPGTPVTFEIQSGGGTIRSPSQQTGADGTARPEGWILGMVPGENRLAATTLGVPSAGFTATGVPAIAAAIVPTGPTSFAGLLGNFLNALPEVRVTDAQGAPVAGVSLTWSTTGGGAVVGTSTATDFDGRGAVLGWRLGPTEASQATQVTAAALPPVLFTAAAAPPPASQFAIEIRYPNSQPSVGQKLAFDQAVARWTGAILGDLTDIPIDVPASTFGCYPALNETVDDLLIFADLVAIDGPGGVLGSAGPCLIRTADKLTVVGRMRFDTADLANLEVNGQLNAVILHEMGHVLGVGSLWQSQSLLAAAGSSDPFFLGRTAQAAFLSAAEPAGFRGNIVPVENTGGAGTRDVHWRESTLGNELMTGFLNAGTNLLSAITLASLRDQGYLVNDATGDPYSLPQLLVALGAPSFQLREVPPTWPVYTVNRRGAIDGILPKY
ncbi:MAG: hypothetical protein OEW44_00895 [Gemmatimonadota bacterium]|nr:hypothetical protein [Gemmatimonadota bacterium]